MARVTWPLVTGRPAIEVLLSIIPTAQKTKGVLLADTGAGSERSPFEMVLSESDCLVCGATFLQSVKLRGTYAGVFPLYGLPIEIPQLGFSDHVEIIGVPRTTPGFDGIAGFRFLNRFIYGNFGDRKQFGIEL